MANKIHEVRPTGTAADAGAIQATIDLAGSDHTIKLLSRDTQGNHTPFNFGDPTSLAPADRKSIIISRPLTIEGEEPVGLDVTTGAGAWPTQIYGGESTFIIHIDPSQHPNGKVTIKNLQFGLDVPLSGAYKRSIMIFKCTDVEIRACKFAYLRQPAFAPINVNSSTAISVAAANQPLRGVPTGTITIDSNVILSLGRLDRPTFPLLIAERPLGNVTQGLPPDNTKAVFIAGTSAEINITNNYVEDFNQAFHVEFGGLTSLAPTYLSNPKATLIRNNVIRVEQLYNPASAISVTNVHGRITIEFNDVILRAGSSGYGIRLSSPLLPAAEVCPSVIRNNNLFLQAGANRWSEDLAMPSAGLVWGKEGQIANPPLPYGPYLRKCNIENLSVSGTARYGLMTDDIGAPPPSANESSHNSVMHAQFATLDVQDYYIALGPLTHDNDGVAIDVPPNTAAKGILDSGTNNHFQFV